MPAQPISDARDTGLSPFARFFRFSITGGIGCVIEAIVLTWLVTGQGVDIYLARGVSFSLAVTATWLLNRRFAFAGLASNRRGQEYSRYFLVQVVGAVINLAVFASLVGVRPELRTVPVLPLAAGAAVALVFNFAASRWLVFRGNSD